MAAYGASQAGGATAEPPSGGEGVQGGAAEKRSSPGATPAGDDASTASPGKSPHESALELSGCGLRGTDVKRQSSKLAPSGRANTAPPPQDLSWKAREGSMLPLEAAGGADGDGGVSHVEYVHIASRLGLESSTSLMAGRVQGTGTSLMACQSNPLPQCGSPCGGVGSSPSIPSM